MAEEPVENNPNEDSPATEGEQSGVATLPEESDPAVAAPPEDEGEKPVEPETFDIGVPGVASKEQAQAWVKDAQTYNTKLSQLNAEQKKQIEVLTKKPADESELDFTQLLEKYTNDGTANPTNAALKVLLDRNTTKTLGIVTNQVSFERSRDKASAEIKELASQGLIPEWRQPEYDGQTMTKAGSDFYHAAQSVKGYMVERNPSLRSSPDLEFWAVLGAIGMEQLKTGRKGLKDTVDNVVKTAAGGRSVTTPSGKKADSDLTDVEVQEVIDRMKG